MVKRERILKRLSDDELIRVFNNYMSLYKHEGVMTKFLIDSFRYMRTEIMSERRRNTTNIDILQLRKMYKGIELKRGDLN